MKKTAQHEQLEAMFQTRTETVKKLCEILSDGLKTIESVETLSIAKAVEQFEGLAEGMMEAAELIRDLRDQEKALAR